MRTILLFVSLAGFALTFCSFVFLWLRERNLCPLHELLRRFRRLPLFGQVLLGLMALHLIVYGSSKTPTNPPPTQLFAPATNIHFGFTQNQLDAGFVLARIGTNETWDFSRPATAQVIEPWRLRGAAEDWAHLNVTGGPHVVFSDGRLQDAVKHPGWRYLPFATTLGIVPEGNWSCLPETNAESLVWYETTAEKSLRVTWRNVLLNRQADAPVSFQAEFFENGNFIYRYDLSSAGDALAACASNVIVGATNGEAGDLRFFSSLVPHPSSLFFQALDSQDAYVADRDGDGVSTYDEIFVYRTDPGVWDSDGDGRSDGEEVALGLDPLDPDTDKDGLVDGSDPDPSVPTSLSDADADGIPDAYEQQWFGGTDVCDVVDERDETGWTLDGKIATGANPTNPASSFTTIDADELVGWKLWDGFMADWSSGKTNLVYERTIPINRTSTWQQFFLSSSPSAAGAWSLQGLTLEWEDSNGACGTVSASPYGDSLWLPLSTNNPQSVTFRLRATGTRIRSVTPVHLLCYAPTFEVEGGQTVTLPSGEKVSVFIKGSKSEIGLTVDRSRRPCKAGLYPDELMLSGVSDMDAESGGSFRYEGDVRGGVIRAAGAGVFHLPQIGVKGVSARPRLLRGAGGTGYPIIVLMPSVWYGEHKSGVSGVGWNGERNYIEYYYPLDSNCLWREWLRDGWGGWWCDCSPGASSGLGEGSGYVRVEHTVDGNEVTGTIYVGDVVVWSDKATHILEYGYSSEFEIEKVDACDDCETSCADGYCDALEMPSCSSLKFRIPLGNPRGSQISGFAYFTTEEPIAVSPSVFDYLIRRDADVTVTTNGTGRTVVCRDNRGRDLAIATMPNGTRVTITTHATGALEHVWEITNVDGDDGRIHLHQISRLNNTMQDWLFEYVREDEDDELSPGRWQATDLVSGVREEVEKTDDLTGSRTVSETRTTYDLEGNWLGCVERVSTLIGEREVAALCETSRREWTGNNELVREADYWRDTEHPARNGKVRLLTATDAPWQYCEWDSDGRETLILEQRNGSAVPEGMKGDSHGVDPSASYGSVTNLPPVADAFLTVYDYEPLAGDANLPSDYAKVRTETRYVVRNGEPTLIGRTWHRFTHDTVSGYPTVRDEETRAATPTSAFADAANVRTSRETFDEIETSTMPIVLRGRLVAETDADGRQTACTYSVADGVVTCATRKTFGTQPFPTYEVVAFDAVYGNELRRATCLTANDVVIDEETSVYDDQNRLRSTSYLDGTSLTNAYSCCRKLWSRDRQGRQTLRSAVTGEDKLYFAEEEVWLREIATNGQHKVTQHFVDGFGRETNTVVYLATIPGEANAWTVSNGKRLSTETTSYAGTGFDFIETQDARGKHTVRAVFKYADHEETDESTEGEGVAGEYVVQTNVRNGRQVTRQEWNGLWTERISESDYDADGCRVTFDVTVSSDGGTVTNAVTRHDFFGREIERVTPRGTTTYIYDGTSSRVLTETTVAGVLERTTAHVYDGTGEEVGTTRDGVTTRSDIDYEESSNVWWKVTRDVVFDSVETNSVRETRKRLTGLSDDVRQQTVAVAENGVRTETTVSYDATENLETETMTSSVRSPVVRTKKYGLVLSETSASGTTTYAYDALGRVTDETQTQNGETRPVKATVYNAIGEVVSVRTWTNGTDVVVESYGYDAFGRRTTVTNALGDVTVTTYDAQGNVLETAGATERVRYGYDSQNRRTSLMTTRDGSTWDTTTWTYDPQTGACTTKRYADGGEVGTTYTPDGLMRTTTQPSGQWMERQYDAQRRLVGQLSNDGAQDAAFAYDAFSRMVFASNAVSQISYELHRNGIATNEVLSVGVNTCTIVRSLDAFGRIVGRGAQTIAYDSESRIASIADGRVSATYLYDGNGLDIGCVLTANGLTVRRSLTRDTYRPGLVTSVTNTVNGTMRGDRTYRHDALMRVTGRNDDAFGYDEKGRVTYARINGWNELDDETDYAYDGSGNFSEVTHGTNTIAYTANACNQYTAVGADEPTHTMDGCLATWKGKDFVYDSAARLTSVATNGVVIATFAYDAFGRRVRKVTPEATRTFFYDGWNLVREVVEYESGTTDVIEYFWGKDLSGTLDGAGGIGGLLYVLVNGEHIYIPLYDANGNVTEYVDANGTTVAAYCYDAFGRILDQTGTHADAFRFRFSTKYFDAESGLCYYGYRSYVPDLARWLTRDPIEESGGLNLYAFCENDGVNRIDAWGYAGEKNLAVIRMREIWRMFATVYWRWIKGFWLSPDWLENSLQDSPVPGKFTEGMPETRFVKGSNDFKKFVEKLANHPTRRTLSGSYSHRFYDDDLSTSIHDAKISFEGTICRRKDGSSIVDADYKITDTYNFEYHDDAMAKMKEEGWFVQTGNNLAFESQCIGAIVPFPWFIEFHDKRIVR